METKVIDVFEERGYLYLKVEKVCEYTAGQYFVLEYKGIRRPYSTASSPLEKDVLFLIKLLRDGEMSKALSTIKKGEVVELSEPQGNFTYEGRRQAFFAGGSGIAPIRGIVKDMELRNIGEGVVFYSCREDYFPFLDELMGLKRITVVPTITGNAPEGWQYSKGRINAELVNKYRRNDWDVVYICGSVEFAKTIKDICTSIGINKFKIEAWG